MIDNVARGSGYSHKGFTRDNAGLQIRDGRMIKESLRRRLEKLENKQKPVDRITVNERTDGLFEWESPDGKIELVDEAEYRARGGIIVTFQDRTLTKEDRKRLKGSHE